MAQAPNSQYTQPGMAATYQLMAAPGQNFPIMLQPSLVKKKKKFIRFKKNKHFYQNSIYFDLKKHFINVHLYNFFFLAEYAEHAAT